MVTLNKKLFFILFLTLFFLLFYLEISFFYSFLLVDFVYLDLGFEVFFIEGLLWQNIKILFVLFAFLSVLIISMNISFSISNSKFIKSIFNKHKNNNLERDSNSLQLVVGLNNESGKTLAIPEYGLFQNILITGTIGSGKTSSAMYPFTKQLLEYKYNDANSKIGMLILDVKGNYFSQVYNYAQNIGRLNDLIEIKIKGKYFYNPLDKPFLKPSVIANQLKTILLLFSPNNSESYWLDKAEAVLTEAIKLCRLYNNNYVTFTEIHNLVTKPDYYHEKIANLREKFTRNELSKKQIYNLLSAINFFEKEFLSLDLRTLNILRSEITRITNCFVSDFEVERTFCPPKNKINFHGFKDVINLGKIVVLNMNINEFRNLSKIISAYLKIDFQTEVMRRLTKKNISNRVVAFISDEYSEYVTSTDANFFSQSREARCINIISTQSYNSILNTLNNKYSTEIIVQNLVNKIWFRTDDIYTIENAQKQIGKVDKERLSKTISENAKQTNYNFITRSFNSKDSSISESINTYVQNDYVYDFKFFTQELETFNALCFLTDGNKILPPCKIELFPYFK